MPASGEGQGIERDDPMGAASPVADETVVENLVAEVMTIQRRFGHAMRNAQSDRRDQIREAIERAIGSAA